MRSQLLGLFILSTLVGHFQAWGVESTDNEKVCIEQSLSFRPYSSSYLPWSVGALTELRATGSEKGKSQSVLEKLDRLAFEVLGKKTAYQSTDRERFYRPEAPEWMGFCDQWSAASLDSEVDQVIKAIGNINCAGVRLSQGEIQELFTGYYKAIHSDHSGIQILRDYTPDENAFLNSADGLDKLSAGRFDEVLSQGFRSGTGAVLSLRATREVWNQPVFKQRRCESKVFEQAIGNIPLSLLSSDVPVLREWLSEVVSTDETALEKLGGNSIYVDELQSLLTAFENLSNRIRSDQKLAELHRDVEMILRGRHQKYSSLRLQVQRFVQKMRWSGLISLKQGLTLSKVKTEVSYGVESEFAEGGHRSQHKVYKYVLVRDDSGAVVNSFWDMPHSERPGFVWRPVTQGLSDLNPALKDLIEVATRCESARDKAK